MRSTGLIRLCVGLLLFVSGCGGGGAPASSSTSGNPASDSSRNLAELQKNYSSAVITPAPWAGYWFPYRDGGISDAAEKYDEVVGGQARAWEYAHHGQALGHVAQWWGHCNGWTAAAILAPEPRMPLMIGGVRFGVDDRKALLSEIYMEVTGDFIGTRVDDPNDFSSEAFNDVWPAQMYFVLTGVMGAQHRAVALDRYTGYEVWNQPLVAYVTAPIKKEDYLGPDPQFPNIYRVNMQTTLYWLSDGVMSDVLTPAFDISNPADVYESRTLRYELWVDAPLQFDGQGNLASSGNIILTTENGHTAGGIWKNSGLELVNSYPDYMWIPTGAAPSTGFRNPYIDENWVFSHVR